MNTIRGIGELRRDLASLVGSIGLVPTMGALHAGHEALIRAARAENDVVVVSLFVNPAQFDEGADLAAYPRDEARDLELAATMGVDVLFAPPPEALDPLMRRTIENGFELTGPISRGDWETVDAHIAAIRAERPELEPMYVTLAETTKALL